LVSVCGDRTNLGIYKIGNYEKLFDSESETIESTHLMPRGNVDSIASDKDIAVKSPVIEKPKYFRIYHDIVQLCGIRVP
jgi:hypothetical protein